VTYNYNQAGWLNSVDGYINGITYNARGQKKLVTYANNLTTTLTYNDPVDRPGAPSDFRLFNRMTSANQQNLTYLYDPVGNITSIDDSLFTASRTFTYDDLNRLETASGTFGSNQSQQDCTGANRYIYNAIGNITGKCGAALDYNDPLHPSAVTFNSATGRNYTYDANGNMTARGTQTLSWDIDNRVTSVSIFGGGTTSMEYDYTGMRVKKDAPTGITLFPFKGYEIAPGGTITKFIRLGNETLTANKGGEKLFYHNDHLGGVNVITDINGAQAQVDEYDTWGAVSKAVGNIDQTHRFTGQELDPESGLYYYGGRYYDQEIGRFVSPDPFVQAPAEPQTLNRYGYVLNSPQNYIDPSGYEVSSGDGGGSYSGGFFNWWSWYHFFDSLFGGDDKKPQHRPKPKQRTHHQQQIKVENEGREPLKNVSVYNSQVSAGLDQPTGNARNDNPDRGPWWNQRCFNCDPFDIPSRGGYPVKIFSFSNGGVKMICKGETGNGPCQVIFSDTSNSSELTIEMFDQKVDPRCEQCKINGRIVDKGELSCNIFGGTCDASGRFTPHRPPPREQTVPEIWQRVVEHIFGPKGVAEE